MVTFDKLLKMNVDHVGVKNSWVLAQEGCNKSRFHSHFFFVEKIRGKSLVCWAKLERKLIFWKDATGKLTISAFILPRTYLTKKG
jgi:hypothetical protein